MPLNIVLRRFAFYFHNYRTSKKNRLPNCRKPVLSLFVFAFGLRFITFFAKQGIDFVRRIEQVADGHIVV